MIKKCLNLRIRSKGGIKYQVCLKSGKKWELGANLCYMCEFKEYKKAKPIKKVSKKRVFVTEKTYNAVFVRDKGRCRLCGDEKGLHLHHILYRSQRKDLVNDVNNCILLCIGCHALVHSNKKKYQPMLMEMIKNETN